jgi:hypothetical protein
MWCLTLFVLCFVARCATALVESAEDHTSATIVPAYMYNDNAIAAIATLYVSTTDDPIFHKATWIPVPSSALPSSVQPPSTEVTPTSTPSTDGIPTPTSSDTTTSSTSSPPSITLTTTLETTATFTEWLPTPTIYPNDPLDLSTTPWIPDYGTSSTNSTDPPTYPWLTPATYTLATYDLFIVLAFGLCWVLGGFSWWRSERARRRELYGWDEGGRGGYGIEMQEMQEVERLRAEQSMDVGEASIMREMRRMGLV